MLKFLTGLILFKKRFVLVMGTLILTGSVLLADSIYDPSQEPSVRAVSRALPSVVSLTTESTVTVVRDPFADMLKEFQGMYRPHPLLQQKERRKVDGFGSGVIIDSSGYIVSNFHTIKEKKDLKILVALSSGEQYPARIVAIDDKNDLALLKIESKLPLPAVTIANSDEIMLGQTVLALGNPFGLDNTVTQGIISAKSRNVKSGNFQYEELIQTDVAINPGNSGGALIDLAGRLIGVNVLVLAKSQGISFAIPSNRIIDVLCEIFSLEKSKNINFGLRYVPMDGVIKIRQVLPQSSTAGELEPGDKIISVDGKAFFSLFAMQQYLVTNKIAGDPVEFVFERNGQKLSKTVRLKEFTQNMAYTKLGIKAYPVSGEIIKSVGLYDSDGLLVTSISEKSPAYLAGLRPGMILASINGVNLGSMQALEDILKDKKPGEVVNLGFILIRKGQDGGYLRQDARLQVPLL